jgi:hypothetical protein
VEQPSQIYKEEVATGTKILMESFSLCVDEMFKKPLIISNDTHNPFAELPTHIQFAIIQSAFTKLLAQQLASMALMGESAGVEEKNVLAMGRNVLKHEFELYLKAWRQLREQNKIGMDKGPQARNGNSGIVYGAGVEGSKDKEGPTVRDHHDCGQDGEHGHKAVEQPPGGVST